MTDKETIMPLLLALLQAAQPAMGRNTPLMDLTEAGTQVRLSDGPPSEDTDVFINGPRVYEFTMSPVVLMIVSGGTDTERDASLATMAKSIIDVANAITDELGEGVFDIRPQPVNKTPRELVGAPNVTAVELSIEIDYESDSSAG